MKIRLFLIIAMVASSISSFSKDYYSKIDSIVNYADCCGLTSDIIKELHQIKERNEKDTLHFNVYEYCRSVSLLSVSFINEISQADSIITAAEQFITIHNISNDYPYLFWMRKASLYYYLQNYETSIDYLLETKKYLEHRNDYGIDYAQCCEMLAPAYIGMGDLLNAKLYIGIAEDILKESYSNYEKDARFSKFELLETKATLYYSLGNYEYSKQLLADILDQTKNNTVFSNIFVQASLSLSAMYCSLGMPQKGLNYLEKIEIDQLDNSLKGIYFGNRLICCLMLDNTSAIEYSVNSFCDFYYRYLASISTNFSISEIERLVKINSMLIQIVSLGAAAKTRSNNSISSAYNNILYLKDIEKYSNRTIRQRLLTVGDSHLIDQYRRLEQIRHQLLYGGLSYSDWITKEKEAIDLDKSIARSMNLIEMDTTYNWECVQNSLDKDEAAIEFVLIPTIIGMTEPIYDYGALIVTKKCTHPILVKLDSQMYIDSLLDVNKLSDELYINQLYSKESSIYSSVWKKIAEHVEDVKKIYVSTVGALSRLSIPFIKNQSGMNLYEEKQVYIVSSTMSIPSIKKERDIYNSIALFGGINYNAKDSLLSHRKKPYFDYSAYENSIERKIEITGRGTLSYLAGSLSEVDSVSSIFDCYHFANELYTAHEATEESFKLLDAKSPSIIHVATHGFYLRNESEIQNNEFVNSILGDNYENHLMVRTGLLFAGANSSWNKKPEELNHDDGILTAEEISHMDLSNTKLVVLSACDTGLGEIDPVSGVIGLQRAFKKAGVQSILMSLWKVADESTVFLMNTFYKELLNGNNIYNALLEAQKQTSQLYPDPYYYAGFFVLD